MSTNSIQQTPEIQTTDQSSINQENEFLLDLEYEYPNIAMVKPVFTAAAYDGYYPCYRTDIDYKKCFDRPAKNSWSTSRGTQNFIDKLKLEGYPENKLHIITDITVHEGDIFDEFGVPKYNTIVFFHNEYVTMREYSNMVNFIKAGGNVIILNGNAFFAEVIYDETTNRVKLVSGHGWNFDGENGTHADVYYSRFRNGIYNNEHQDWFGSRYYAFRLGPTYGAHFLTNTTNPHPMSIEMVRTGIPVMASAYQSHEENSMITQNAHIIADWNTSFAQEDRGIKIYELLPNGPIGGSLIHFGFFGSDILQLDQASRTAFLTAIRHQAGFFKKAWIRYPYNNAVLKDNIIIDYPLGWKTEVYLNDAFYPDLHKGSKLDFLDEGDYSLKIIFSKHNITTIRIVNFSIDRTPPSFLFNNNSTFEIPPNYPNSPLNITLDDQHPDYLRVRVQNGYGNNFYMKESGNFPSVFLNQEFSDGKYLSLEGVDAAGNEILKWYIYNSSAGSQLTREIQPFIDKINSSMLKIGFPIIEENITARVQITENYGKNWTNIPFTEKNISEDNEYAYYKRNGTEFLFRVAIEINNFTHYVHNIKSYHWDNTIFRISNHNISSYHNGGERFKLEISKNQFQNTSIRIQWLHQNSSVVQTEYFGYSTSLATIIYSIIPNNLDGMYIIRITIESNHLIWSHDFNCTQGIIPDPITNHVSVLTGVINTFNNSVMPIDRVHSTRFVYSGNGIIEVIEFGAYAYKNIQYAILPGQNLTIYLYDDSGNPLGFQTHSTILEIEPPQILGSNIIVLEFNDSVNFEIEWQISDIAPSYYEIYFNGSIIMSENYYNNVTISCSLKVKLSGVYNYTILAYDRSGNFASETVIIIINPGPIPPTETISNTPSTKSSTISTSTTNTFRNSTSNTKTIIRDKQNLQPQVKIIILSFVVLIATIRFNKKS